MPPFVEQFLGQARQFWATKTVPQRILIAGLVASAFLAFAAMLYWLNHTEYRPLYAQLYPEDAAQVVEMLQKEKIPYRLDNGGTTVLVPADKVYDVRLKLAGEGTLRGQGLGFEIFDANKIGQTSFVQNINYQRALQGELARTISELPEVESARVHLVLPAKSLFVEEQTPPSAAVMLKLKGNRSLSPQQVQAVVNLVASSVAGLTQEHITVTDNRGKVLFEPKEKDMTGMSATQMEYQRNLERNLERRIEELVAPVVGQGKVIAKVTADLDLSRATVRKEIFDPKSQVIRSEIKSDESSRGSANVGAGPNPRVQGENDLGASGTNQETSRTTATTNYEINREEQEIISQAGSIRRLSVAVLVDGVSTSGPDGTPQFQPLPVEQLERIRNLAQRAVGFDAARGDAIEVTSIPFGEETGQPQETFLEIASNYFQLLGKPLLNTLVILIFLVLVVRPIVLALIKPKVSEEATAETLSALGAAEERKALLEGLSSEEMEAMESAKRIENAKILAQQLVEQNMEQALMIMRQWLAQGEA
jgi:flagellar M-ring protein FliF